MRSAYRMASLTAMIEHNLIIIASKLNISHQEAESKCQEFCSNTGCEYEHTVPIIRGFIGVFGYFPKSKHELLNKPISVRDISS